MSLIDEELSRTEAQAAEKRRKLAATVIALQSRLKPSALARDAVDEIKEIGGNVATAGIDTVKRNPVATMGVVAALTALIARKPIARLFGRRSKPAKKPN